MKKTCINRCCAGLLLLVVALGFSSSLLSQTTAAAETAVAPAAAAGDGALAANEAVLNRIADLEAYINNTAPKALVNVAGPGHNGFIMICAALVLFMTLPSLALFYGGLVRSKNILSVMAQCLGCAEHKLRVLGLPECVLDVSVDVRDHHSRLDRGRHCPI